MEYRTHNDAKSKSHQPTQSFMKDDIKGKCQLNTYMKEAQDTLVRVVENYKNLYGKSVLD